MTTLHIGVVIPARNEELLLPRCLQSVLAAKANLRPGVSVDIAVIDDGSTDRTRDIASGMLHTNGVVHSIKAGAVGTARCTATKLILKRFVGPSHHCWLANTDADCVVPRNWLTQQLQIAETGIDAIAGTVSVDSFAEHEPDVPARFKATYTVQPDGSHSHVHGANLGIRADAYLRAGGWSNLTTAEDHDLWRRLTMTGARTFATASLEVQTSGRKVGRAPNGFAGTLAAHSKSAA